MNLIAYLLPVLHQVRGFQCRSLLLVFLLGLSTMASAQKGRYLQTINLTDTENKPFFATIHSLPAYILAGIKSGELTLYWVDYATTKADTFTADERQNLLEYINDSPDSWTYLSPDMLGKFDMDVTRNKRGISRINYLNFHMVYFSDDVPRMREDTFRDYYFSVSFDQLAAYLTKQNALWVKNAGPLHWNNNIVHTYGLDVASVLHKLMPKLAGRHVALTFDQNGAIDKIETYSARHKLVQHVVLPDSLHAAGEILPMHEALLAGHYQASNEMALDTKLPEIKSKHKSKPIDRGYMLTQTEKLYLYHPANKVYSQPEQELSTLLLEPVSKGTIPSVYTSDSLLTLMPKKEWDEKLTRELYIKHEGEYSFKEVAYVPRDFSLVTITWKQHIDHWGQVTSREPFALGVFLGAEAIPFREELLIGYLSFAEVYQSAKAINGNKQLLRLLDSIVSDTYMGYLSHTSEIMVDREKGKE